MAKVVADERLEPLIDQVAHAADTADHPRRFRRADIDDLTDIEVKGEAIADAGTPGKDCRPGPRSEHW